MEINSIKGIRKERERMVKEIKYSAWGTMMFFIMGVLFFVMTFIAQLDLIIILGGTMLIFVFALINLGMLGINYNEIRYWDIKRYILGKKD